MNIHPLLVHFPIALLVVYSLVEFVPSKFASRFSWWHGAKVFLLTLGLISAVPTYMTGDSAKHFASQGTVRGLINKHENFATFTIVIYLILLAAYLVKIFKNLGWGDWTSVRGAFFVGIWKFKQWLSSLILDTILRPLFALGGLVAITITGALGAAIVYGPNIDPFVTYIYNLFF